MHGINERGKMKSIYVVISRTGTFLSKIIKHITGDRYTHAALSFDDDLSVMYSFGRKFAYFPFYGAFVKESPNFGVMKRFPGADIAVIKLSVSDEKFDEVKDYIVNMYAERKKYGYNYKGLFFARRGIYIHRENKFYCSEFVKDILERFGLVCEREFNDVVRPAEMLNLKNGRIVFRGKLSEFAKT